MPKRKRPIATKKEPEKEIEIQIQEEIANEVEAKHYVDQKELKLEIMLYQKDRDPNKVPSDKIGRILIAIAENYTRHHYFYNYTKTYKEEMVGCAVQNMIEKLDNCRLDIPKSNPFFYFSRITYNAFRKFVKTSRKRLDAEKNYRENEWTTFCFRHGIYSQVKHEEDEPTFNDPNIEK